jgi:hypothetical protein
MKKIILVLFLTITLISFANAKTVIFKNCFYAYESKFDNKKWEKNEGLTYDSTSSYQTT